MGNNKLGRHILVEFYNCDSSILNDTVVIETHMNTAATMSKATIVESVFHTFNPWGVSGVVVIQESHLTIHTWPEYGYAAIDLFTCGEEVDPWIGFKHLKEAFKAEITETLEIPRGDVSKIDKYSNGIYKNIVYKPIANGV